MAREEWGTVTRDNGVMEASTGDTKTGSGGKTVRFVAGASENTQCDNRQVKPRDSGARSPQLNMVQSLVPHLPGLEKDKVYVISGPFPNFDPVSGPSQMLMATPVTAGATIIAVPTGPPPPHGHQNTVKHQSGHQPPVAPGPQGQQAPVFHPPHPHMLHWDQHHPGGQIIPLRQPCGPVYYNMPGSGGSTANSSGLQSPASEGGSCMSESSSTSGDQDMSEASSSGHSTQHMMAGGPGGACVTGKQMFWQPGYPQHMPPMVPGYPAQHVRNNFQPGPPQYCHMPAPPCHLGPMMVQPHPGPHGHHPHHFNQVYISQ